jgi:8-oxo-dGTP diphosphatase
MMTSDRRPTAGVGVVIIQDGALLLVLRGRGANRGLWAVPGGKVEYGETMRSAAAREALEETGLEVAVRDVAWVGDAIGPGNPPEWHYTLIDFFADAASGDLRPGDDAATVEWVPLDQVLNRPVTPTMIDLMRVIAHRTT